MHKNEDIWSRVRLSQLPCQLWTYYIRFVKENQLTDGNKYTEKLISLCYLSPTVLHPECNIFDGQFASQRMEMAANQFLNPIGKILLCIFIILVMGYYFTNGILAGEYTTTLTFSRGAVLLAFIYLLISSVLELTRSKKE
jgi:hypothetical protein